MNTIKLGEKSYPLVYSASVACKVNDRFGDADEMVKELSTDNLPVRMRAFAWLAAEMMASAYRRLSGSGAACTAPLSEDTILDMIAVRDMPEFQRCVMEALLADSKREVEAEPPKNADTTPVQA